MYEKVKQYITDAVEKGFAIENIINKLVEAGHKKSLVKRLAKEALNEKIKEIEPHHQFTHEQKPIHHIAGNILLGTIIRITTGTVIFFTLAILVLQTAHT